MRSLASALVFGLTIVSSLAAQVTIPGHSITVMCCGFTDSVSQSNQTTVSVGTTVVWSLLDSSAHTVTSGNGSADPLAGSLFDEQLNPSNPSVTYQFTMPGVYNYFCQPHEFSGMTGTITVTVPASQTSIGAGCTGSNNQVFSLATSGLPQLGNQTFALLLTGGVASGQAHFFIASGIAQTPLSISANCNVYLEMTSLLAFISAGINPIGPFPLSPSGAVTFLLPLPLDPQLMGFSIAVQGFCADPGAPAGAILTNARTLVFCV